MSLAQRIGVFDDLASRLVGADRPHPLMVSVPVPLALMRRIQQTIALFVSASGRAPSCIGPDDVLFMLAEAEMPNLTPNGMLVPKMETTLAFNCLVQAFADVVAACGVDRTMDYWHLPPNVRYKHGYQATSRLGPRSSERVHSDAWAGDSPHGVGVYLPVFGDLVGNRLRFYGPPNTFQESWLDPLESYGQGENIASQYTPIVWSPPAHVLTLFDQAVLHASVCAVGAGPRVSIDARAIPSAWHDPRPYGVHPDREAEYYPARVLETVGTTVMLAFPDRLDDPIGTRSPFRHSSTVKVVTIIDADV